MTSAWKFRIVAFMACLFVGGISGANLSAEILRPLPSPFPGSSTTIPSQSQIDLAHWVASIAPGRTDLQADAALALATGALLGTAGYRPGLNQEAQAAASQALEAGPHDSRIWLVLARLHAQRTARDPRTTETLRLSYFTGPGLDKLVPARLATVVSTDALNDPDLRELARGDVRLILTRHPELKPSLIAAYRSTTPDGKRLIEESVKDIDPQFVTLLSGGSR